MLGRGSNREAMSARHGRPTRMGGCVGIFFFGIFFVAGSAMLYFMTLLPLGSVLLARGWIETPCTIVSSEVGVNRDSDGDTYKIEVEYTYDVGGREFTGQRYNFMLDMYSGGREGKQEVVQSLPPGTQTVCHVNPNDPADAVLNRGLTADMWWGLFPFPFFLVGSIGLLAMTGVVKFGKQRRAGSALSTGVDSGSLADSTNRVSSDAPDDGPFVLKESTSPLGKFIGISLFSLFWNGIVSIFVWQIVESFREGRPEWCPTIFMIPFVLVGLGSLVMIVHSFLAIFNPRPTLTLSRRRIPLGEAALLTWKFRGSTSAIRSLKVTLKGEEQATYRRGTDTHTAKETFYEEVLTETIDSLYITESEAEISIPSDTMHTFQAKRNKVVWTVHFAGEIPLRPDVSSEFEITVSPHEPAQY